MSGDSLTDKLLASLLAEPPSSSLPSSSLSVPASSPSEPKATSIAKAKQAAPQIQLTHRFRRTESDSPSPASTPVKSLVSEPNPSSTPTKPKNDVSLPSLTLPSKKRGAEEFGIGEGPVAKRRDWKQRDRMPAPRAPRAKYDHWSPPSSRASSPVRSTPVRSTPVRSTPVHCSKLVPAEKWYAHLKTSHALKETETRRNPSVSVSNMPAVKRHEKAEDKKYTSWAEAALAKAGEEEKVECYNCGTKGHWFMDCLSGCGNCNGDGHRTIDCGVKKVHIGLKRAE